MSDEETYPLVGTYTGEFKITNPPPVRHRCSKGHEFLVPGPPGKFIQFSWTICGESTASTKTVLCMACLFAWMDLNFPSEPVPEKAP